LATERFGQPSFPVHPSANRDSFVGGRLPVADLDNASARAANRAAIRLIVHFDDMIIFVWFHMMVAP